MKSSRASRGIALVALVATVQALCSTGCAQRSDGSTHSEPAPAAGCRLVQWHGTPVVLSSYEQALYAVLDGVVKEPLTFDETPLEDALRTLAASHGLTIMLDAYLKDAVGPDVPVTADLENVSVASALRRILDPLDATYYVQNEMVHVTTKPGAEESLAQRVYDVGALCGGDYLVRYSDGTLANADVIAKMIRKAVDPDSWDEVGGPASVEGFAPRSCVVVSQTEWGHEQVARFLVHLRRTPAAEFRQRAVPDAVAIEASRKVVRTSRSGSLGGIGCGCFGCGGL